MMATRSGTAAIQETTFSRQVEDAVARHMEPTIRLYAELLLNIRSVTLSGSVRSYTASESIARLFTDGNIITVSHEGVKASIELPAKAIGTAAAEVTIPAGEPRELSSRLQVDGDISDLLTLRDDDASNLVPWSAPDLPPACSICCQKCGGVVVPRDKLTAWKDLPSANWAEMMDFWHCHKPPVAVANGGGDESAGAKKGYAAGSRVSALVGTGLVDLSSFLLWPDDCTSVKVIRSEAPQAKTDVKCQFCRKILGAVDQAASGYRLQKRCMAIYFPESEAAVSYSTEKWLATLLLSTAESSGVRKFSLRTGDNARLIWLFSPDLYFCSSTSNASTASRAVRAAKILWKNIPLAEYEALQNASSVEDLDLPLDMASELLEILATNQELLPQAMRLFDGWDVSLLARFSPDDLRTSRTGEDSNEQRSNEGAHPELYD